MIQRFEEKLNPRNADVPRDVRVDRRVYKVRGQQMADEQQQGLDSPALHQPQVTHGRHRGPVGPQERHRAQDGGQSFRPREKDFEEGEEKKPVGRCR